MPKDPIIQKLLSNIMPLTEGEVLLPYLDGSHVFMIGTVEPKEERITCSGYHDKSIRKIILFISKDTTLLGRYPTPILVIFNGPLGSQLFKLVTDINHRLEICLSFLSNPDIFFQCSPAVKMRSVSTDYNPDFIWTGLSIYSDDEKAFYNKLHEFVSKVILDNIAGNKLSGSINIISLGTGTGHELEVLNKKINRRGNIDTCIKLFGMEKNQVNVRVATNRLGGVAHVIKGDVLHYAMHHEQFTLLENSITIHMALGLYGSAVQKGAIHALLSLQQVFQKTSFLYIASVTHHLLCEFVLKGMGFIVEKIKIPFTRHQENIFGSILLCLEKMIPEERLDYLLHRSEENFPNENILDLTYSADPNRDLSLVLDAGFDNFNGIDLSYCYIPVSSWDMLDRLLLLFPDLQILYHSHKKYFAYPYISSSEIAVRRYTLIRHCDKKIKNQLPCVERGILRIANPNYIFQDEVISEPEIMHTEVNGVYDFESKKPIRRNQITSIVSTRFGLSMNCRVDDDYHVDAVKTIQSDQDLARAQQLNQCCGYPGTFFTSTYSKVFVIPDINSTAVGNAVMTGCEIG